MEAHRHPFLFAAVILFALLVMGSSETGATDSGSPSGSGSASEPTSVSLSTASRADSISSQTRAMSIPPAVVTTLAVIGGVVVALVGAGIIAVLVLSMFGVRMCYILGTCQDPYGFMGATPYEMPYPAYAPIPYPTSTYHAKSSDGNGNELPQYDAYSQVAYPTGYQKRSLDYVGPILKVLGSAYGQHYGQPYYNQQINHHIPGTPQKSSELTASLLTENNHNPDD